MTPPPRPDILSLVGEPWSGRTGWTLEPPGLRRGEVKSRYFTIPSRDSQKRTEFVRKNRRMTQVVKPFTCLVQDKLYKTKGVKIEVSFLGLRFTLLNFLHDRKEKSCCYDRGPFVEKPVRVPETSVS